MDHLSREHQEETDRLIDMTEKLGEELENVRNKSADRINDLETSYEHFKHNSEQEVEKLVHELK